MPKNLFKPGNPGKPKGATNLVSRSVKDCVLEAFNEIQKDPDHKLISFAKKYPRDFYNIAAKLIPTEVSGQITNKQIHIVYGNNISRDSYSPLRAVNGSQSEEAV